MTGMSPLEAPSLAGRSSDIYHHFSQRIWLDGWFWDFRTIYRSVLYAREHANLKGAKQSVQHRRNRWIFYFVSSYCVACLDNEKKSCLRTPLYDTFCLGHWRFKNMFCQWWWRCTKTFVLQFSWCCGAILVHSTPNNSLTLMVVWRHESSMGRQVNWYYEMEMQHIID